MSTHQTIGQRIREARIARGMTQEGLAARTGLKDCAISHFETGTRAPCLRNLGKLCRALRVTSDSILGLTKE